MGHFRKQILSILLNNRCNLSCTYCYLSNKQTESHKVIDIRFAKKGIDEFFAEFDSHAIRFFAAGEPTLEFQRMRDIRKYAESKSDGHLFVELQTNGVFSKQVAEWIAGNIDIVWISYDGLPQAHDLSRRTIGGKPTSATVEKNIHFLVESGNVVVGVRSTISSLNVHQQTKMVEYCHALGIRSLQVDPIFDSVSPDHKEPAREIALKPEPMDFARSFLDAWNKAKELELFFGSSLTWNFDEHVEYACRACLPCPHLTPDGYVSACDMATSGDTTLSELIYGVYDPNLDRIGYDEQKISLIRERTAQNMVECQGCEVLYNCAGGCLGESLNETGSFFRVKKDYCDAIRFLAKNMPLNAGLYPYFHP